LIPYGDSLDGQAVMRRKPMKMPRKVALCLPAKFGYRFGRVGETRKIGYHSG
jgi:hypothetical protein